MANEKRLDLIDRNALLERENEAYLIARQHPSGAEMFAIIHRTLQDLLKQAPTVEAVEVVHGRWIEKPYLLGTTRYCSICGQNYGMPHGVFNYCPNCGAKMDEGNEDG